MKYRKKPVFIEAFIWGVDENPAWAVAALENGTMYIENDTLFIRTLAGIHQANSGDYIIRGMTGELYPCKSDIFEMTYEAEINSLSIVREFPEWMYLTWNRRQNSLYNNTKNRSKEEYKECK